MTSSHIYNRHSQNTVSNRRVKVLMRSGGLVEPQKRMYGGAVDVDKIPQNRKGGQNVQTGYPGPSYARGGRAKGKPHINVNIISRGSGPSPMAATGLGAASVPPMPSGGGPAPFARGGRAGGGGGAGGPGGGYMRKPSTYMNGISTPENLKAWHGYASKNTFYAKGGRVANTFPRDESTKPAKLRDPSERKYSVDPNKKTRASTNNKTWATSKPGGGTRTNRLGKMMVGKVAGQGAGAGLVQYARRMKKSYP